MLKDVLSTFKDRPITVWFGDEPKQLVKTQWLDQREFKGLSEALIFVRGSRSQHSFFSVVAHLPNADVDLTDQQINDGIAAL